MNKNCAIIVLIILFFSCSNVDNRTDKEIENLIKKNKNNLVFLNFWDNMSDKDFKRVLILENKKGNLTRGKYIFKVPSKNYYSREFDEISFNLTNDNGYIRLNYEDEFLRSDLSKSPYYYNNGIDRAKYYANIINTLQKHYNSKYEKIPDFNYVYLGNLGWKIKRNKKFIGMSSGVYYYDKYKYGENRKIIAKCNISLYYSSYSTFIKKKEDNLNEIKLKKEKRNKEKKKANESNNFL